MDNILLVAVAKKAMHITRADAKQVVTIYNAVWTRHQQIKVGKYSDELRESDFLGANKNLWGQVKLKLGQHLSISVLKLPQVLFY